MKRMMGICFGAGIAILAGSMAWAAECPQEVAVDFPACKEAKVVQTTTMNDTTMVVLDAKEPLDVVSGKYKSLAEKSGWKIVMEMHQESSKMLMGEKAEQQIILNFQQEEAATMVQITVVKKS